MIYIENNLEKQDVFIPRNDGSTCYVSPYDKGYQDGYQDGIEDCGDCPIQQKEVVLTATTETISPDQGYAGMDSVFVDARQLALEKYNEGYHEGEEDGAEEQKSKLETATFDRNGEYTREDGWSAVTVDVPKEINLGTLVDAPPRISDLTYDTYINTFVPQEASVDGWGKVQISLEFIIGDAKNQQKALMTGTTFTQNGLYRREDGWNEVIVEVPQTGTSCNLESKTETVTADTQTILPSSGYDGMSEVVVDATDYGQDKYDEGFADGQASVPPCPEIESAVTYGIGSGFTGATITPSSGYDGMAEVTITDNGYGQEKYDEGYSDGQASCPQPTLEQKSIVLTATSETVLPSSGYDGMSSVEVDASNMVADLYNEGYEDGYDDGRTLNLQHKNATQTATTQTHYPDNTNGSLTIIGEANIPTNFIPYTAYTGNSNYLRIEIDNVWNGRKGSNQYLYTVLSGDTRFSCERFRYDNYPYLNVGDTTGLGTGPENGTEFHTWAVVLDNGTVTSYIDGVVSRTGSFVGAPSNTALVFAPPTDARNLNATFYSVKFKDANGNLIAEFVPNSHNGGAIKDTVSNTIYDKTGSGTVTFNAGYDGMSAITVDASGLCQDYYDEGYQDGLGDCPAPNLEQKSVTLTATTETVTPSQGYDGMNEVSINASGLCQNYYNSGYTEGEASALSGLTDTTFTRNGTYTNPSGWSGVTVDVKVSSRFITYRTNNGNVADIEDIVNPNNNNIKWFHAKNANGDDCHILGNMYLGNYGYIFFDDDIVEVGGLWITSASSNSIIEVTIPNGVEKIDRICGNSPITTITLPNSLEEIGFNAFYASMNLTSLTIPSGVTTIGEAAFADCTSLPTIVIPDSVTDIGVSAFQNCPLSAITLGTGVQYIGRYAFDARTVDRYSLKNIYAHMEGITWNLYDNVFNEYNVFWRRLGSGTLYVPNGHSTEYADWLNALPSGWTISDTL